MYLIQKIFQDHIWIFQNPSVGLNPNLWNNRSIKWKEEQWFGFDFVFVLLICF